MSIRSRPPTLSIIQPSGTTIAYTVSNAPLRLTRLFQLIHVLTITIRIVLAAFAVTYLLWASGLLTSCAAAVDNLTGAQTSTEAQWLARIVKQCTGHVSNSGRDSTGAWFFVVICALLLWILSRRDYIEESLLVIRGLGIQTSSSSSSYLSTPTTRFIPTSQIQDIFIHEAFKGFEVRFYLAVIVEGEEEAVVVFPKLLPKREILEEVWRGSRTGLYQNKIY